MSGTFLIDRKVPGFKERKMIKKDIAVIGLGKFGSSLAMHLSEHNYNVIAIDSDPEKVADIAEYVTFAATADVSDIEALRETGIANVDIAVVCIGSIENSILVTVGCKELGVPQIIAKAGNEIHAKILEKIGADRTLIPEAEMGVRLAKNIIGGMFIELFEISEEFSLAEVEIPNEWIGESIANLKIREKYDLNIVAIKNEEQVTARILPDIRFQKGDIIVVAGDNMSLKKFNEK